MLPTLVTDLLMHADHEMKMPLFSSFFEFDETDLGSFFGVA